MKVVINACFGGFSISIEAARFMAARGNNVAKDELHEHEDKIANIENQSDFEKKHGVQWYGYGYTDGADGYDRSDPDLVAAVEELGKAASGNMSALKVVEIPDGTNYEIEEYDGNERVAECHKTWS